MKKKNILTAAVSLSLVACLSIGATLAYFTDKSDTMTNVFTTGKVDMTLIDETEDPKGQYTFDENGVQNGILYTGVVPGDDLDKRVSVLTRDGSSNAHVGIVVTVGNTTDPSKQEVYKLIDEAVARQEKVDGDKWLDVQNVNVYDGKNIVPGKLYAYNSEYPGWEQGVPANTLMRLFSDIKIPTAWDNDEAEAVFDIKVQAYALQAENTAPSLLKSAIEGTLKDDNGDRVEFQQYGD